MTVLVHPVDAQRRGIALLVLASIPMLCLSVWAVRLPSSSAGLSFTPWHTLLELASMLVCGAVATLAWNARELEVPRSVRVLGSACAGALLLDLAHTLSFPGMADLITPNTSTKTAALFMASRLLTALALLGVAALPWRLDHNPRWVRGCRSRWPLMCWPSSPGCSAGRKPCQR